jgi:transcriptional regulator with XRE-family HTH domain
VILHRDGGPRRDDVGWIPASVPEIGRFLRRERTQQGISIEEVGERTGLAVPQLQGLEGGTVDRLPDRVQTLKVLRRYADFLGLPGDQYVLVLVDHWPTSALSSSVVSVHAAPPLRPDDTGVVAQVRPEHAETGWVPLTVPEAHLVDHDGHPTGSLALTAQVNSVGPVYTTAQVPRIDNTGPLPIVDGWSGSDDRGTSLALRILIVVLSLALVAGIAGIVINWTRPQWLADLGITHNTTHNPRTTTTTAVTRTTQPEFSQVSTSPGAATFVVRSKSFVVAVVPVGSPSWVQATTNGSIAPEFSGVVQPGAKQAFTAHGPLVVQVGASSARLFVSVGSRLIGSYAPPGAPFTITFRSG